MQAAKKIVNTLTGLEFCDPNPHLLQYAISNKDVFVVVYDDVETESQEKYSEGDLKEMSMKALQEIADRLEVECDRRRKDSLISGILESTR